MVRAIKLFLNLGLFVIPFFFWPGSEPFRGPKEMLALTLSLLIGCMAIYSGILNRFRHKYILLFVWFSLVCFYLSPQFWQFKLAYYDTPTNFRVFTNIDISNFWSWKVIYQIVCYFLLLWSVSSLRFRLRELKTVFFFMALSGFLMSLLVLVQYFGLDQLFVLDRKNPDLKSLQHLAALGGTIGQSTLVSPFIGMIVPLAIYLRRWAWVSFMILALILTDSQVAQGAAILSCLVGGFLLLKTKKQKIIYVGLVLLCFGGGFLYLAKNKNVYTRLSRDNGRLATWKAVVSDLQTEPRKQFDDHRKFVVTGFGPGTYEYYSTIIKNSRWGILHNEPLETLFNFGLIGTYLFLGVVWSFLLSVFSFLNSPNRSALLALFVSLLCISFSSLGTFPWHIEPMRFYSVVVFGLLLNPQIQKEKLQ